MYLLRYPLASVVLRLRIISTATLAHAVILALGAAEMESLELVAVGPKPVASSSTVIAVSEPFTLAPGLFPVANLHLAAWAKSLGRDLERSGLAVGVDADAVGARCDDNIVVDVAGAVDVVASLEAEVEGYADAVVVVLEELAAVCDELVLDICLAIGSCN